MTTRTSRWLALALVSCAACTYSFPDPKDVSQVYKCAGPDDCSDGFSCVDQVCLEDAKFGTELVTVVGRVKAPAELVSTSVQNVELTVPVISGAYELQVPVGDGSQIVTVYSRGSAADGREGVRLGSVLGDTARLKQLAGTSGRVTANEVGAVDLTPFTTAELGAVCATGGDSVPATRAALVHAEQNLAQGYTEEQLLEVAAALRMIVEDPGSLPAGSTTLDLACDPAAMRDFLAQWRGTWTPPDDPITATVRTMLADTAAGPAFRAASLPPSYFSALKSRHGFIGGGDERIILGASGSGTYQAAVVLSGELPVVSATTWAIQGDGGLTVALDTPDLGLSVYMTGSEIASYYSDTTTQDAILAALGTDGYYPVPYTLDSVQLRRLAEGTGADWVVSTTRRTLRFAEALASLGPVVSDVQATDAPVSRFFHRSDALEYRPWPSDLAYSTWAMQLVLPSDLPYSSASAPDERYTTAALVLFNGDGTATVGGGVVPLGGLTFTWTQAADGVVTLTYPDHLQRQRMVLWDSQPGADGMLAWYEVGLFTDLLAYGPARRFDIVGALSGSEIETAPGEYWQTDVNAALYPPEAGDGVPPEFRFGFELRADGTAIQHAMSQDTANGSWQPTETPFVWRLFGPEVWIEVHMDQYGPYSTCVVGSADPSCFVQQRRRWEPVSISPDGKQLNMIESNARVFEASRLTWDSTMGHWTYDGAPFDVVAAMSYLYLPRMGTYTRMPLVQ